MQTISVSTLNEQIKHLLETTFMQVAVEGELSRATYHSSGHIYFSIKDENSQVKAVMFKGNAQGLKFRLEEGMKVVLIGALTLYKPRGEYQLNVSHVEPAGVGNLALAFKQLKEKLSGMGLFALERKKPQPRLITHMALITSSTGAALQDMLRLVSKRWPMVRLTLIDVLVQGDKAADEITQAIHYANTLSVDAIVVSRGGGSIEDLWPFNEERVAMALAQSKIFTVSAVGHEIDWVITDYVADMRAATPTAAMELLLPDQWELFQTIDALKIQFQRRMSAILGHKAQELTIYTHRLGQFSIDKKFKTLETEMATLWGQVNRHMEYGLEQKHRQFTQIAQQIDQRFLWNLTGKQEAWKRLHLRMEELNPQKRDKKGWVELTLHGKKAALDAVQLDDTIALSNSTRKVEARVTACYEF